jgi:D-alanyl-D-alanine carboxypeptidase
MSAKEKIRTFFSIYGPITLGLVLLFVGSTWQSSKKMTRHSFPVAGYRTERGVGGDSMPTSFPMAQPTVPLLKNVSSTFTGTLTAAAAVVVDDTSNAVLFNKNGDAVRPLASISKLMSALVYFVRLVR